MSKLEFKTWDFRFSIKRVLGRGKLPCAMWTSGLRPGVIPEETLEESLEELQDVIQVVIQDSLPSGHLDA